VVQFVVAGFSRLKPATTNCTTTKQGGFDSQARRPPVSQIVHPCSAHQLIIGSYEKIKIYLELQIAEGGNASDRL